jgi:hypothetical protein
MSESTKIDPRTKGDKRRKPNRKRAVRLRAVAAKLRKAMRSEHSAMFNK